MNIKVVLFVIFPLTIAYIFVIGGAIRKSMSICPTTGDIYILDHGLQGLGQKEYPIEYLKSTGIRVDLKIHMDTTIIDPIPSHITLLLDVTFSSRVARLVPLEMSYDDVDE